MKSELSQQLKNQGNSSLSKKEQYNSREKAVCGKIIETFNEVASKKGAGAEMFSTSSKYNGPGLFSLGNALQRIEQIAFSLWEAADQFCANSKLSYVLRQ